VRHALIHHICVNTEDLLIQKVLALHQHQPPLLVVPFEGVRDDKTPVHSATVTSLRENYQKQSLALPMQSFTLHGKLSPRTIPKGNMSFGAKS
jgi:hypothetical protein